jgi:hypothetical protein
MRRLKVHLLVNGGLWTRCGQNASSVPTTKEWSACTCMACKRTYPALLAKEKGC